MYAYHMCAWCLKRSEEGIRLQAAGITEGCELVTKPGSSVSCKYS